jgi:hypothetical protein
MKVFIGLQRLLIFPLIYHSREGSSTLPNADAKRALEEAETVPVFQNASGLYRF